MKTNNQIKKKQRRMKKNKVEEESKEKAGKKRIWNKGRRTERERVYRRLVF
jgi:hypothetical protein